MSSQTDPSRKISPKEPVAARGAGGSTGASERETQTGAEPLSHHLVGAILLQDTQQTKANSMSRRDLLFAARLLELRGAIFMSTPDLVAAIREALRMGVSDDRVERDVRCLVETLQLAGRPTAANGLLATLRTAA